MEEKNELKVQKKILEHQRLKIEATWKFENMHEMTPRLDRYENQKAKFQKAEKTLEHTNQVETENLVLKIKLHEFEISNPRVLCGRPLNLCCHYH